MACRVVFVSDAPVIVIATLQLGLVILIESSLSFLGYGVPPASPTWGGMHSGTGRTYLTKAPWLAILLALFIALAMFAFNVLGDGLSDELHPGLRGTRCRTLGDADECTSKWYRREHVGE